MANNFLDLLRKSGILQVPQKLQETAQWGARQIEYGKIAREREQQHPSSVIMRTKGNYVSEWPPQPKEIVSPLADDQPVTQQVLGATVPTPMPTPSPSPLPKLNESGQHAQIITKYFPQEEWENVSKTLNGENKPRNYSAENKNRDGSIDRGLFQINSNTFNDFQRRKGDLLKKYGINNYNDMFDPELNTIMAKIIWDEQGWDAWYGSPPEARGKEHNNNPLSFLFPQAQAATNDNLPVQTTPSFLDMLGLNVNEVGRQLPRALNDLGQAAKVVAEPLRYENILGGIPNKILPRSQDAIRYETLLNSTNLTPAEKKFKQDYERKQMEQMAIMMSTAPVTKGGSVMQAEMMKNAGIKNVPQNTPKLAQIADDFDDLITPEYGKRMTPDELTALKMRLKGATDDEIIKATNMDAFGKVMRRLEGEGYVPDFENALNAKDKIGASKAIQEMFDLGDKANAKSAQELFKRTFEPQPIKHIQFKPSEVIADKVTPKLDVKTFLDTYNKSGGVTSTGIIPEAERVAMEKLASGNIQQWELVEAGMPKTAVSHAQLRLEGQGAKVDLLIAQKAGNPKLIEKLQEVNKQIGNNLVKQKFERITMADIPKKLNNLVDLAKHSKSADDFIDTIVMAKEPLLEKVLKINPILDEITQVQREGFRSLTDFYDIVKGLTK